MRFRPEQHLRRQNDIRAVRELGVRSDWRLFTLWVYQRPDQPSQRVGDNARHQVGSQARVGVVASIAAVGNAVQRARAKRRLREVFRAQQQLVPAGVDLLLVARTAINKCSFGELEQRFAAAVARIKGSASALGTTRATND